MSGVLTKGRTIVKTAMGTVELTELPVPEPGPGEVIVRTTLSTICGSDIHVLDDFPMPRRMPVVPMGHEAAGVVAAVGAGVTRFQEGDRIVGSCVYGCGSCASCQDGALEACLSFGRSPGLSNALIGCQGEYFRIPYADLNALAIPDALTDEQAIFAGDIMSTGFSAIERGGVEIGDTVAIFAQGPVGLCATTAARLRGAGLVIGVDGVPERRAMSLQMGANHALEPDGAVQRILELTGGRGVDVGVEALGHQATFRAACEVTRIGGTVASVGLYAAFRTLEIPINPAFLSRKIVTSMCPAGSERLRRLFDAVVHGGVDLTPLFTHRMTLDEGVEAYELFKHRRDGCLKIAITP